MDYKTFIKKVQGWAEIPTHIRQKTQWKPF